MNAKEHQQALIKIKDDAQDFIRTEQFRGFVQDFLHRYDLWQSKLAECQEAAKHNSALIIGNPDEPGEPPQPGWEAESRNEYLLKRVDENKPRSEEWFKDADRIIRRRFWRPPLPPNPVELLMPVESFYRLHQKNDNLTPDRPRDAMKDDRERLAAHAFLIAVVCCKLSDGIIGIELPEDPTDKVWEYYSELDNSHEYHRGDKIRSKLRDALFDVKHVCIQKQQAKQIVEIVKTDSIPPHQAAVLDIANKVDWLVMDASIRARFTEHIDRFCKMVEDYGQALQPYEQQLKEAKERLEQDKTPYPPGTRISLVEYCPPPKDWVKMNYWDNPFINVDMGVIYRPTEPVNPLLWLGIIGNASLQRKPEENEKLMCEYVRLAITHDYELRYSGTPTDIPIISVDYKGKWFQRDKFCEDVWKYYHYNQGPDLLHYPATDHEKLTQLDRAFARVQTDIAGERQKKGLSNQNVTIIRDILAAIEEWKRVADKYGPESEDAKQLGSKAVELLCQHVKLLDDFQLRFGASVITQRTLAFLADKVNSVPPAERFSYFYDYETYCEENFIADLKRWIQEASTKQTSEQEKNAKTKTIPKEPSDEARKAYQLYGVLGNQKEVAKAMNKELHRKDFYQGKVSRLIKQYKRWLVAAGLPDVNNKPKRKVATVDPEKLYLGRRKDGRATGDPLNKRQ